MTLSPGMGSSTRGYHGSPRGGEGDSPSPYQQQRPPLLYSASWGDGLSGGDQFDPQLVHTPRIPPQAVNTIAFRPQNFEQKAALNRGWLDSSRCGSASASARTGVTPLPLG